MHKINLNLNQHPSLITAHMCVRIIVHNCRTQQHRTVLIIFPLILQIIIIAQMMSTGGEGICNENNSYQRSQIMQIFHNTSMLKNVTVNKKWLLDRDLMVLLKQNRSYHAFKVINYLKDKHVFYRR